MVLLLFVIVIVVVVIVIVVVVVIVIVVVAGCCCYCLLLVIVIVGLQRKSIASNSHTSLAQKPACGRTSCVTLAQRNKILNKA